MNRKILGVKLSTYLTVLVCLIAAFVLWLIFNLPDEIGSAFVFPVLKGKF